MAKYVDISQYVSATYYDEENQEWSQKIVTIEDVLCSVCDEYEIAEIPELGAEIVNLEMEDIATARKVMGCLLIWMIFAAMRRRERSGDGEI